MTKGMTKLNPSYRGKDRGRSAFTCAGMRPTGQWWHVVSLTGLLLLLCSMDATNRILTRRQASALQITTVAKFALRSPLPVPPLTSWSPPPTPPVPDEMSTSPVQQDTEAVKPPVETSGSGGDTEGGTMHVALAADAPHLPGIAGAVNSARKHSSNPHVLRFHVITRQEEMKKAVETLRCYGLHAVAPGVVITPHTQVSPGNQSGTEDSIEVIGLPADWLHGRLRVLANPSITGHLDSPLNFARFYLAALLPAVQRVIYLDADIVVRADLRQLWITPLPGGVPAAAVPRPEKHFRYSRYASKCDALYAARNRGAHLATASPTFNAGVLLIDLREWRAANVTQEAEWWLEQHMRSPEGLWKLGSQPVLHLILHGRWAPLPERWNLDSLGRVANIAPSSLDAARLLHWTGRRKPWLADGLYTSYWREYVRRETQRRCST